MRLLLDVTETFESQLNTGIQRVVRRVCRELYELQEEMGFDLEFIVSSRSDRAKGLYLKPEDMVPNISENPTSQVSVWGSSTYVFLAGIWKRLESLGMSRALQAGVIQGLAEKIISRIHVAQLKKIPNINYVTFTRDDVLLVLDAFWGNDKGLLLAKDAKASGAKVVTLINDVFPLSHPELCDANNVIKFERLVGEALELADYALYPSLVTLKEIELHLPGSLASKPHKKVHYGHDGIPKAGVLENEVNALRIPKSICVVGTIEPRKNLDLVFKWFLEKGRFEHKLTVIGKPGWLTESLQKQMRNEQRFNDLFTWHEAADDELLTFELSRHEIGIMASHAEGFGLPVVEMSNAGLKLVLSDIPIFHEVAGVSADFFEPTSVVSLDSAINKALSRKSVGTIRRVTWADTATEIMDAVLEVTGR